MNNLRFSLILIVICFCDYICTVPYGSINKVSSINSAAPASASTGNLASQYDSLNQVDGGSSSYGKIANPEPTEVAHHYGTLKAKKNADGYYIPTYASGIASAASELSPSYPNLQLDLLPPFSGADSGASTFGGSYSGPGFLSAPQASAVLPAGVSLLKQPSGQTYASSSPYNRPTGVENGGTKPSSYGNKYGSYNQQEQQQNLGSYQPNSGAPAQTTGFAAPPANSVAGEKYTGGFGGAPGVLGEQKVPGYAVQPKGSTTTASTSFAVQPSAPATSNPGFVSVPIYEDQQAPQGSGSYGGNPPAFAAKPNAPVQPSYPQQQLISTGSYGGNKPTVPSAAAGNKYTGGFGGAPGVLGNQAIPGYAVKPTVAPAAYPSVAVPGSQPTQTTSTGFVSVPVYLDTQQPSSSGSYGGSQSAGNKPTLSSTTQGNKYTGSFGGAPGVLGNQPNPGFAVKPTAPAAYPQTQPALPGSYGSGNTQSSVFATQPTYPAQPSYPQSQTTLTGSYNGVQPTAPNAAADNKYTGSFEGAPGVLGNQPNQGFAVKPTAPAAYPQTQPALPGSYGSGNTQSSVFATQPTYPAQPSYPQSQPTLTGSYNGVQPTAPNVAADNKYTGSFGGAPGVLGNQPNPGFAVKPTAPAAYPQTQPALPGSYGSGNTQSSVFATQPTYPAQPSYPQSQTTLTGSYNGVQPTAPNAAADNKYTGSFGGAPGVLGNQPNQGFAVKPTVPAYQQPIAPQQNVDFGVGHLTNVNSDAQGSVFNKPSGALLPPTSGGHTSDHKIVFSYENEPTPVYSGIKPIYPVQQVGSYGNKPSSSGSYGGVKPQAPTPSTQGGSYGKKPIQPAPVVEEQYNNAPVPAGGAAYQPQGGQPSAVKPGKYTGGFGGSPGVLGEQKIPGYVVQPDGTIREPTVAGPSGAGSPSGSSYGGNRPQPQPQPQPQTPIQSAPSAGGSYHNSAATSSGTSFHNSGQVAHDTPSAAKPGKYTGGFGGSPGVLGEQKTPGFAVQPNGTIRDPTLAGATGVAVASQGNTQQKSPAGSYHHAQDNVPSVSSNSGSSNYGSYGKYTAGFGGPPGVLSPYDNLSAGKYRY